VVQEVSWLHLTFQRQDLSCTDIHLKAKIWDISCQHVWFKTPTSAMYWSDFWLAALCKSPLCQVEYNSVETAMQTTLTNVIFKCWWLQLIFHCVSTACVRACVRACVCVCVLINRNSSHISYFKYCQVLRSRPAEGNTGHVFTKQWDCPGKDIKITLNYDWADWIKIRHMFHVCRKNDAFRQITQVEVCWRRGCAVMNDLHYQIQH
jgi:hypothetical protein